MDDGVGQQEDRETARRPPFLDLIVGPGLESDNRRFGELLERLRRQARLSRADAAVKLGLSAEYLRLIEVGKRTPALGHMQNFLDAYGADAEVERVMPGGDRPDLVVIDPLNGDPVIVEFKSRIREARRSTLGGPTDEEHWPEGLGPQRPGSPSASRAAELGVVVLLFERSVGSWRTSRQTPGHRGIANPTAPCSR
jgi:transcriptional regulator with XRE-family HTH domain